MYRSCDVVFAYIASGGGGAVWYFRCSETEARFKEKKQKSSRKRASIEKIGSSAPTQIHFVFFVSQKTRVISRSGDCLNKNAILQYRQNGTAILQYRLNRTAIR